MGDQALRVQDAIVEVRRSSEELLAMNVDTIKQLNIGQYLQLGHYSPTCCR